MSYSDEMIKAIFAKYDLNGDGFITKEELLKVTADLNVKHTPAEIDAFFAAVDTNKDNKLSYDEFAHFMHFKTSQVKELDDVLKLTAGSIAAIKKLDQVIYPNFGDTQNHHVVVRDATLASAKDLPSQIRLLISSGKEDRNTELQQLINYKTDPAHFLVLKFHVKEKAALLGRLPQLWTDAKTFLKELGPEPGEFFDKTDAEFFDGGDGVLMAFRAKPDSFINNYLSVLKSSSQNLGNLAMAKNFTFACDLDLAQLDKLSYEQLAATRLFFEYNSNSVNVANMLFAPDLQKWLAKVDLNKHLGNVLALLTGFCLKTIDAEVLIDTDLRARIYQALKIPNIKNPAAKDALAALKAEWENNPSKDLVDSMEFLKETVTLLHDAKIEGLTLYIQVEALRIGLHFRLHLYDLIHSLVPLK